MDQARHNRWDTIIKSTALILSVCLAVFGFWQYRELKEREFKKEFYKKQIETIDEVVKILLSYGTTEKNKDKLYIDLSNIFYGKGRLYLDQEMFHVLNESAKYVAVCEQKLYQSNKVNCEQWDPYGYASLFAKTARKSLGENWKYDFDEITAEDPWNTTKIRQ